MMKFSTAFTILLLLFSNTYSKQQHYINSAASDHVQGAAELWYSESNPVPNYIRFNADFELGVADVENWLKEEFQWPLGLGLRQVSEKTDEFGITHTVFQLNFNDVDLEFSRITAHWKDNKIKSISGDLVGHIEVSNLPVLSGKDAIDVAISEVGAASFMWDDPQEEAWLKEITGNASATFYPSADLVILPRNLEYNGADLRYAFKVNISASDPYSCEDIYVDAEMGDVIFRHSLIHEIDTVGKAYTGYSGLRQITTGLFGNFFRLREDGRGSGIVTLDMNNSTSFSNAIDFTDEDNNWQYAPSDIEVYGTDAHWASEMTYDFLDATFGINSIDDNGQELRAYIHYGESYNNAFWNGQLGIMVFGDGSSNLPYSTIDIVAHEAGHGLTQNTAGLIYQNESGALNESFSDILGNCVEFFGKPGNASWRIGEDRGDFIRDMSFPNAKRHPDTYNGDYWYTGTGDNGGVHINSGVMNHWFYLVSEGGNGINDHGDSYDIDGIGMTNAAKIAYRNLSVYLTPSSKYEDAVFFSTISARDIFGDCSPQHEAVAKAWGAVGFPNNYVEETVAEFYADEVDFCHLPLTIQFSNESVNGLTYEWDFGDGTTSTEINPTHEYTTFGDFDVTLKVDGEGCGIDEVTKNELIKVNLLPMPTAQDAEVFKGDSVVLEALSNDGEIHWYADEEATEFLGKGNEFQTPALENSVTYYIKSIGKGAVENVGPVIPENPNPGQYSNLNVGLTFDVHQDMILQAFNVSAQIEGRRKFFIRNANSQIIFEKEVDLVKGIQNVSFGAEIPKGVDYTLSYTGNVKKLWIGNDAKYPYTYSGLVSIKGNSLDLPESYPFFFDWKVSEMDCESDVEDVRVSVEDIKTVERSPYNFYVNNADQMNYFVDFFFRNNTVVDFALYGINGQLVTELRKEYLKGNSSEDINVLFNLSNLPSGVYFVAITGGGLEKTEKIVNKGGSN